MIEPKLIKMYIKEKKYTEASEMLRNDIINTLTQKIKKKNKIFEYTNIYDLEKACDKYLGKEMLYLVKKVYFSQDGSLDEFNELQLLLDIYENLY